MNPINARVEGIVPKLATAIVIVWIAACALGHIVDVRLTIMAAAIGMALVSVALLPRWFGELLTPSISRIAIGLAAALVMVAATYVLFPIVGRILPSVTSSTHSLYGLMRVPRATAPILIAVALIVIGEEILWRGVVQDAIERRIQTFWSVPIAAVVYGLSHAPIGSPLLTIVAVICGLYWSTLRNRTGSLLPSLIAHLIWDMAILTHPLIGR